MLANLVHLAVQAAAAAAALVFAWVFGAAGLGAVSWGGLVVIIGGCAGGLAWLTGRPWWWRWIHGMFMPLAWLVSGMNIESHWFLIAFILLVLVYWGAITGRVPLYLSNGRTASRVAVLARERRARAVLDIGAGVGSIVVPVARAAAEWRVTGVENAPLTWLAGLLVSRWRGMGRVDWRFGSFWDIGLGGFDLVYAFLSPEPMEALWLKVQAEMDPGSLFVSNSFVVPGVVPSEVIEVDDRRGTRLYCYVIG